LSDKLEYKQFDILIIDGYKGRRVSIEKIVTMELDDLIAQVKRSGNFDESRSVFHIRAERKRERDEILLEKFGEMEREKIQKVQKYSE